MTEPTQADIDKASLIKLPHFGLVSCTSGAMALYKQAWDQIARAIAEAREEGRGIKVKDDGPCYYCGEPTNGWSGNPDDWPLYFCHSDDPGKMKYHHTRCVTARLVAAPKDHILTDTGAVRQIVNQTTSLSGYSMMHVAPAQATPAGPIP